MPNWSQLVTLWRGLSRRQQLTVIAGTLLLGGTLLAFVELSGKEEYKTLYSGLQSPEIQNIVHRLDAQKIPYEMSSDGSSVRIPSSKLDAVRLDMASQGLPQSGRLGFELFDHPNWAGSDFAEKVNYQRALEGELERTIQSLGAVESVRVHLVLPRESLFSEEEKEAKASVVLKLRGGYISDDSIHAVTRLVASAVDGLKPENVSVIDDDGRKLSLVSAKDPAARRTEPDVELADKLVAALTPVAGPGRVKANVNVDYDYSTTDLTSEAYDPNQSVVLSSQTSEERSSSGGAGGVPGTSSNAPNPVDATARASADTPIQRTDNKTFGVGKTVRHTVQPAGQIRRIAAAVLIDDGLSQTQENGQTVQRRRKRTPEEMQKIQDVAAAALGIDPARGDKLAVANLPFEGMKEELPAPLTRIQRIAPVVERWTGALRYLVLVIIFLIAYLLVLRPLKKQMLIALRSAAPAGASISAAAAHEAALTPAGLEIADRPPLELPEAGSAQRTERMREQVTQVISKEPLMPAAVIRGWIGGSEGAQ